MKTTPDEWIEKRRRVLLKMQKAGWITEPPEHVRPVPGKWGRDYYYVNDEGSNPLTGVWRDGDEIGEPDCKYCRRYLDGCFFPFVFERPKSRP